MGLVTNKAEIADIVIRNYEGQPIRVRDVADVEISHEIPAGAVTADGKGEVVLGLGFMLLGENSHCRESPSGCGIKSDEVKQLLPPGVEIVEVYARTDLVDKVLLTARDNLFHGAILVVAALFVFGGGWRAGLDRGHLDSAGLSLRRQFDGPSLDRHGNGLIEPGGDRLRRILGRAAA